MTFIVSISSISTDQRDILKRKINEKQCFPAHMVEMKLPEHDIS